MFPVKPKMLKISSNAPGVLCLSIMKNLWRLRVEDEDEMKALTEPLRHDAVHMVKNVLRTCLFEHCAALLRCRHVLIKFLLA